MYVVFVDGVGIADGRELLHKRQGFESGFALYGKIHCLAGKVTGGCHAAYGFVMLFAPDAAGHDAGSAKMLAHRIGKAPRALLIGAIVGLAAGGIMVLVIVIAYKRKSRSASYPLEEYTRLYLTATHDTFLYRNVVRTARSNSSGGGGGGRSGGGGGRSGGRR